MPVNSRFNQSTKEGAIIIRPVSAVSAVSAVSDEQKSINKRGYNIIRPVSAVSDEGNNVVQRQNKIVFFDVIERKKLNNLFQRLF